MKKLWWVRACKCIFSSMECVLIVLVSSFAGRKRYRISEGNVRTLDDRIAFNARRAVLAASPAVQSVEELAVVGPTPPRSVIPVVHAIELSVALPRPQDLEKIMTFFSFSFFAFSFAAKRPRVCANS